MSKLSTKIIAVADAEGYNETVRQAPEETRDLAETTASGKRDFLSSMSHEIRTPMNAMLGMAELLADSSLTGEQRKYLTIMINNGNALLDLVNDILDFQRVEQGRITLERTLFDPHELAEQVAETLSIRAHQKQLELVVTLAPNLPRALIGDPLRLRQIVINLIGNAIKFTDTGEIELTLAPLDEQGTLHVSVRDTGIGIPRAQLGEVFQRFAQADSSIARRYGGSGLGLAIVAHLTELMGGRVWAESESGQGSTFHFVATFEQSATAVTAPPAPSLRGLHVLVVDDNRSSRRALVTTLAQHDVIVDEAVSGLDALELIKSPTNLYDAILLDNRMPGVDGCETVLRMQSAGVDLAKVILMFGFDELNARLPFLHKLGLTRHVIKPVRESELCVAVAQAANLPSPALSASDASVAPVAAGLLPAGRPAEAGAAFGRPLRVLVADDSEDNRLLIDAFLKKSGCSIDHADNGEEAVRKYIEGEYDVVLMDIQMPVLDGYGAVRQIREWENTQGGRRTPVIALTASVLDEAVGRSFQAGCDTHVSKPVRRGTLLTAIREVVATNA